MRNNLKNIVLALALVTSPMISEAKIDKETKEAIRLNKRNFPELFRETEAQVIEKITPISDCIDYMNKNIYLRKAAEEIYLEKDFMKSSSGLFWKWDYLQSKIRSSANGMQEAMSSNNLNPLLRTAKNVIDTLEILSKDRRVQRYSEIIQEEEKRKEDFKARYGIDYDEAVIELERRYLFLKGKNMLEGGKGIIKFIKSDPLFGPRARTLDKTERDIGTSSLEIESWLKENPPKEYHQPAREIQDKHMINFREKMKITEDINRDYPLN